MWDHATDTVQCSNARQPQVDDLVSACSQPVGRFGRIASQMQTSSGTLSSWGEDQTTFAI